MLEDLKEKAYEANLYLVRNCLVVLTFGNARGQDDEDEEQVAHGHV